MRGPLLCLVLLSLPGCGASAPNRVDGNFRAIGAEGSNLPAGRALIRTGRLTLEVDDETDFGPTLDNIEKIGAEFKGYVTGRDRASIDMRVPAEHLDAAVERVGKLGEVTYQNIRTQDVTADVTDLKVRIDNLQKLRTRLQALVEKAEAVADLMALEKELARVTSDLEALEARQRMLEKDVAYSALHVSLEEEISPGPLGWIPYGLYLGVKWLFVWD